MISRQARIVSGKDLSHIIQEDVRVQAAAQLLSLGRSPRLDVLLVGNDPASMWYAEAKRKIGQRVGVEVRLIKLLADADAADIAATAGRSSDDSEVDGVIVELQAEHLCLSMRGIQKPKARLLTSAVRGNFKNYPMGEEGLLTLLHSR